MTGYTIYYNGGQFEVKISNTENGFTAAIADSTESFAEVLVLGKDESTIYDRCREWASSNIVGEFRIEETAITIRKASDSVAA